MQRTDYYRGRDDASMRHRDTYVGVRNSSEIIPYHCHGISESGRNMTLDLTNLRNGDNRSVRINDESLIIERPNLGMVNLTYQDKNIAMWYSSNAQRQIKKSLSISMYNRTSIGVSVLLSNTSSNMYKALHQTYNNNFPPYESALATILEGNAFSVAFGNKFALSIDRSGQTVVYYKNYIVGYVVDGLPLLLEDFSYLKEQLEEYTDVHA